jgi:hypothetical protein
VGTCGAAGYGSAPRALPPCDLARRAAVDTLVFADAASSIPALVIPTVAFNDDGSLVIRTGCNTGNGSYEAIPC